MAKPSFHLLGDLEKQIMEIVWKQEQVTVRGVVEILHKKREIAYTTVMTVMNRLSEKKLLTRKEDGGAFAYVATQKRELFMSRASENVIRGLLSECGEVAIAQFVEALEDVDPAKLALLEKKIREKRS